MKKNLCSLVFRFFPVIISISLLSCWAPFEPVTHVGKDVVSNIDSTVTQFGKGFKVVDGISLAVNGARTVTAPLPDTSLNKFVTGVHGILFTAGSVVHERSVAYAEVLTIGTHTNGVYQSLVLSPDSSVRQAFLRVYYYPQYGDTNNGIAGHTARFSVYSCKVKNPVGSLTDTNSADATLLFSDTMNSKITDTFEVPLDSRSIALIDKAIRDTSSDSTSYDTLGFYIKSLDTGALFRFSVPGVELYFNASKTDTSVIDSTTIACPYFDISVFDTVRSDTSLIASWESDRFIEIPISLKPLWDSVSNTGGVGSFKIVQAASCSLFTGISAFEKADTADTARELVYGLLDHKLEDPTLATSPIPGTKSFATETRDSLISLLNSGRLAADTVLTSPTSLSLPMTVFLQTLADENPRPSTGYLYLFVRPVSHFGRVVLKNMHSIKFSALFSNPHQ